MMWKKQKGAEKRNGIKVALSYTAQDFPVAPSWTAQHFPVTPGRTALDSPVAPSGTGMYHAIHVPLAFGDLAPAHDLYSH